VKILWHPTHNQIEIKPRNIKAAYSPKKINTNIIPLYSVLKPETSSLSPSTKSKGVRILSARQHKAKTKNIKSIQQTTKFSSITYPIVTMYTRNKNLNTISYETVWATARSPPTILYFEPLPQPAPNLPNTWALNKARITTTAHVLPNPRLGRGHHIHMKRGIVRIEQAATQYKWEEVVTRVLCFKNSLTASAKGTSKPATLGFAAPFRIWA